MKGQEVVMGEVPGSIVVDGHNDRHEEAKKTNFIDNLLRNFPRVDGFLGQALILLLPRVHCWPGWW